MTERFDREPTERTAEQLQTAQPPADHRRPQTTELELLQQRAETEEGWAVFITQAARVLASSLDFQATVDNVLRLVVPHLADWCIASLVNDENRVFDVSAAHADPVRDELLHEIAVRYRFDPGRPFLAATPDPPRPVLVREVTDAVLRTEIGDERVLQLVRALAPASMIAAPLVANDRVVGAISLVRDARRPRFDRPDLARLIDFAGLAALAVDNCRLFRAARRELAERTRTEERLTRSLSLHESTLNATTDGLLVVDTAGRIVSYNHQFLEMWHIPAELAASGDDDQTISLVLDQLRNPEDFRDRIRELYATPQAESFDVLEFTDGRIFERYSRPHRVGDQVDGRVWSFRDVTERTRSGRHQQLLAEASTILASSLDYSDTLHGVAQVAVPLLGDWCRVDLLAEDQRLHAIAEAYAGAEPADRRWRALPPTRPLALDAPHPAAVALRTEALVLMTELDERALAALRATRGEFWPPDAPQSVLAIPLTARGRHLGAMTFGRLGPERRHTPAEVNVALELGRRSALAVDNARLYEAALLANQAKSDFLAVMSHELRTPLTAIMGYTELLADGVSGPVTEVQHSQLKRVDASARHLLHVIEEILSFARVEAGREKIHLEPVDVSLVASEVVMLIHPAATKKGLQIVTALPSGAPPVHTDPGKLRQILINLLANAVKFTERGTVEIAAEREPDGVRVRVEDTGIGIAPDHVERIFDPFWQVEQPSTRRTGGTGLGLSVTRHLARLLDGDVTVKSRLGEGSTFTAFLPDLRTAPATAPVTEADAVTGQPLDPPASAAPRE